jgi:selenocysteine lyase/cysteine desulfurase
MGAHVDNLALVPAVSYGVAIAAKNLPIARGQNVVVLAEQFPSNVYAWREAARGVGAELRAVRRDPNDDWTPAVLSGIDDNTAVVAVPGCHWTDGTRVNLAAVGRSARRVGAALVVGRAILSSS